MIEDRYEVNHGLYILGMISLLGCVLLMIFSLYILPHLLWDLAYDVPGFITAWQVSLTEEQGWSARGAIWLIWVTFMGPSLILGLISYWISNKLDEGLPHLLEKEVSRAVAEEEKSNKESSWPLILTLVGMIGLVVLIVWWV